MSTPLEIYKETLSEFKVTEDLDVPAVAKVTYIQTQVMEQKQILNRLFFDFTIAKIHQLAAKDEITEDAHRKKTDDYRNDIRQITGALKINQELISGLRKEYDLEQED